MPFVSPKYIVTVFKQNTKLNFSNVINVRNNPLRRFYQESKIGHFRSSKNASISENISLSKIHVRTAYNMAQNTFAMGKDETRELMAVWPDIVRDLTDASSHQEMPEVARWLAKALQYNVPVGRKNRALTTVYTYKSLAKQDQLTEENVRLARILGWAIEVFQGFMCVMDDIQDHSTVRRNQPCWHLQNGIDLAAVNDCLLMEMCIYQILKKHFKSMDCYGDLVELFLDTTLKTAMGQCFDLLSTNFGKESNLDTFTMNRYNSLVKHKTSFYTFVLPVLAAMHLVGIKDPEIFRQSKTILLEIGHLFQVRDDYLDCYGDKETTKKSTDIDIVAGKCTWLVVVALQRATPEQRKILDECYGKKGEENLNRVKELYSDLGLKNTYAMYEEETYNLLHTHIQQVSRGLSHEFFLNLLQRACPKVGRKNSEEQ